MAKNSKPRVAKAGKGQRTAETPPTQEPENHLLMPSSDDVKNLARRRKSAKKQAAEISGTIGEAIAAAVEKKHLDRRAFTDACKYEAMSDEQLHISYHHLLQYFKDLGVVDRATAQGRLFAEGTNNESQDGEPAGEPVDTGNVRHIGAAARKVAETAGAN